MDDVIVFLLPMIMSFIEVFTNPWMDLNFFVVIPFGIYFALMLFFYVFYHRVNEKFKEIFRILFYGYCIISFIIWVIGIPLTTIDAIAKKDIIDVWLTGILLSFFFIFTFVILYRRRTWRSSIVLSLLNASYVMYLYVGICLAPYSQNANKAAVGSWILSLTRFFQHNEEISSKEGVSLLILLTDGR
jgi:hypothetical protein